MLFRNYDQFVGFPKLIGVMGVVLTFGEYDEVTNSVVSFIMINMMDNFCLFKRASKVFGHFISVGWNIPKTCGVWMGRVSYIFISCGWIKYLTSFPIRISFSNHISKIIRTFSCAKPHLFTALDEAHFFASLARKSIHCVRNIKPFIVFMRWCSPLVSGDMSPLFCY